MPRSAPQETTFCVWCVISLSIDDNMLTDANTTSPEWEDLISFV